VLTKIKFKKKMEENIKGFYTNKTPHTEFETAAADQNFNE